MIFEVHGGNGLSKAMTNVQGEELIIGFHSMKSEELVLACNNSCIVPMFDEIQLSSKSQSSSLLADPLIENSISYSSKLSCSELTGGKNEEMIDYEELPSLIDFKVKCPPGGKNTIVLYTTSLRGIRKTFEDCNSIRFLLESFRVQYYERDVSMHLQYREELWKILGGRVVPPRLFIKGKDIGGADEVVGLHEQGMLQKFLQGIPMKLSNSPCKLCTGVRFMLCFICNGSCRIVSEGIVTAVFSRCQECNENGLVKCPLCS